MTRRAPSRERFTPPRQIMNPVESVSGLQQLTPEIVNLVAGLVDKRPPRLTRRSVASAQRHIERSMHQMRPYLIGLALLDGELPPVAARYALLEGLSRAHFQAAHVKVPPSLDGFAFQLQLLRQQVLRASRQLRKVAAFRRAHRAMTRFAERLVHEPLGLRVEEALHVWSMTSDGAKSRQFLHQFHTLVVHSRWHAPQRITRKLVHQLATEYSRCASFLEQRLRLCIFLQRAATGRPVEWPRLQRLTLVPLRAECETDAQLKLLSDFVDPRIRNAIAHGDPEVDRLNRLIYLYDRDRIVRWTVSQAFLRTKTLTFGCAALAQFEVVLAAALLDGITQRLWGDVAREAQASR